MTIAETGYWGNRRYESGADIHGAITEAPSELGIKICDSNVNEDQIYWGRAYDTDELDQIFADLRPLEQQTPAYANFEAEFLRDNFRKAAEGRPFN